MVFDKTKAWLPFLRNCMRNGRDQKNIKFSIFYANAPVTHAYTQQNKYVTLGLYLTDFYSSVRFANRSSLSLAFMKMTPWSESCTRTLSREPWMQMNGIKHLQKRTPNGQLFMT